ncbi:hypothetical protein [Salibaculum griseiflavum]|nr:hypothetical protein [Salibaculum griseiflavum]
MTRVYGLSIPPPRPTPLAAALVAAACALAGGALLALLDWAVF